MFFYLINYEIEKKLHVFQIRIPLYYGGGVKYPFHNAFLRLIRFCLNILYCFTVLCQCIDIKHTFKGKYFLKEQH